MSVRRVYFVTGILVNLRAHLSDAARVGSQLGFEVRILDVINLVPGWIPYPNPWAELGVESLVTAPADDGAMEQLCNNHFNASDIFLFLHMPEGRLLEIWRRLRRSGARIGVLTVSPVPLITPPPAGHASRIVSALRRLLRPLRKLFKPTPDIWVVSGEKSVSFYGNFFRSYRRTKFVRAHSVDYEQSIPMLDESSSSDSFSRAPIVFLDQGWFSKLQANFLPDGQYPPTSYEKYRTQMIRLLGNLALASDREVIVTPHPKADLAHTRQLYEGFEIASDSTADVTRRAHFVIGNCSTSIQYAVIYQKPVLLFTSDELDDSIMYPGLLGYQEALGAPVVNIDHAYDATALVDSLTVDKARYRRFMTDYIDAEGGTPTPLWEKIFMGLRQAA